MDLSANNNYSYLYTSYNYIYNIIKNDAFITSGNNIIFEFTPAQTTETYSAIANINNDGFPDVSAIAVINIPVNILNNLFYFQTDGTIDASMNIIKYGINSEYIFNLKYSDASLTYGFYSNSTIKLDYVSYLAYFYTGSTNINVFKNAPQLIQSVVNLDSSFNNTLNQNISNSISGYPNNIYNFDGKHILLLDNADNTNPFYISTKQLLDGMLKIANDVRKQVFLDDLLLQQNSNNIYWVPFHTGDIMSVLINYVSKFGVRSYKIALICGKSFSFPSYVAYNPNGNLDPFYILDQFSNQLFDENFATNFNQNAPTLIPEIYKQIGFLVNPVDFYFKTFMSNITQPSIITDGLMNNGINPSFQYIFLNSTITTILYPSLRTIKASLITSPYNQYPTLNDIQDIQCDLNVESGNSFLIRIYTRPIYSSIDSSLNTGDNFYGNYYDSDVSGTSNYTTYHLNDLFSNWSTMLTTSYNQSVYYKNGSTVLYNYGEQEILAICIYTKVANANIGIKNIIVTYK
jgi:hypothetical protein